MTVARARAHLPAFLIAIIIAAATMSSVGGGGTERNPFCLTCSTRFLADSLLNILLFVPLGAALALARRPVAWAVLAGLLLSASAELVQGFIPSRDPTLRDIAMNVAGTWLGAWGTWRLAGWMEPGRWAMTRLAAAAMLPAAATGLLGLLTMPHIGEATRYFVHWRPWTGTFRPWTGEVTSVRLGGLPLPQGADSDVPSLRDSLRASATLELGASLGRAGERRASIFAISDDGGAWLLVLAQDGPDVILRRHLRSSQIGFETPTDRFAGILDGVLAGAPLSVRLTGGATRSPCLTVNERSSCVAPTPTGRAWSLLRWQQRSRGERRPLYDAVTLALLVLPAATLARSVPRGRAIAVLSAMMIALLASAALVAVALPAGLEWVGLSLALAAGYALAPRLRRSLPAV